MALFSFSEECFKDIYSIISAGTSVNICDDYGVTPLQIAAASGSSNLVELLLQNGAEIDKCNNFGWTPLMHAARNGHSAIVKFLIGQGANVSLQNRLGVSLLSLAIASKDEETVDTVLQAGLHLTAGSVSALHVAALCGETSSVRKLLEAKCEVNSFISESGLTPLMMATCSNNVTVVSYLLQSGCDCNISNSLNHRALNIAEFAGLTKIKNMLYKRTKKNVSAIHVSQNLQNQTCLPHICSVQSLVLCHSPGSKESKINCSSSTPPSCNLHHRVSPIILVPSPIISRKTKNFNKKSDLFQDNNSILLSPCCSIISQHSLCHSDSPCRDTSCQNPPTSSPFPFHILTPPRNFTSSFCSPVMYLHDLSPCSLQTYSVKKKGPKHNPMKSWWKVVSQRFFKKTEENRPRSCHINLDKVKCSLQHKIEEAFLEGNDEECDEVTDCVVPPLSSPCENLSVPVQETSVYLRSEVSDGTYSKQRIFTLLKKFGLEEYTSLFESHEIDLTTFYSLTKDDLEEIGISNVHAQNILLDIIKTQNI